MAEFPETFAKTKILVTLGPATSTVESIKELIRAGIDGVRLNLSHGSYEFFTKIFDNIHSACVDENTPLAVLVDLQGPKIRIGDLENSQVELESGNNLRITTEDIKGTAEILSTSYKPLIKDAEVGNQILIDDGLIRLTVIAKETNSLLCKIESGGTLSPKKGMNLPGMKLSTPSITEKDYKDLEFVLKHRVDYVALSFVRKPEDVIELKNWLKKNDHSVPVIAKIEKKEAVERLDDILKVSDGLMVARGDLGVELPPQEVPVLQKQIIRKCNECGKLVITATQMLESMIHNPIPTRAEASDVANAVWDGTDVVMLSGETSVGKYPVKAVKIMNDIILNAEKHGSNHQHIEFCIPQDLQENLFDSVGKAVANISKQINANAIVVFTYEGRTAKIISKYRPNATIISFSNSFDVMNSLCLRWGIRSLFIDKIDKERIIIDDAKKMIIDSGFVKAGDIVIFTAGAHYSEKSRFNMLKFEVL